MTLEEMKAMAARIPAELSKGNIAIMDDVVGPNAVEHSVRSPLPPTVESTKQFLSMLRSAFPDLTYHLDMQIAERDKVLNYQTVHGTMTGTFMGMPPTGKSATWKEMHIVRFADGKIAEHWAVVDQLGMMRQLGLVPMPGQ